MWASSPSDCVKEGEGGASITGIPLKASDVLQFWKRAPNLNTCYSDMVRHKLQQTRKSRGPGSRVAGAEPVEACPVAVRQTQAVPQNVGAHLKPLTRPWQRSQIPIVWPEPDLCCCASRPGCFSTCSVSPWRAICLHISLHWETKKSSTGHGMSPWNTSKVSAHETGYEICGRLTQRISEQDVLRVFYFHA